MERINRESIYEILQPAGSSGLQVEIIALHLINKFLGLFDAKPLDREKVKSKVNRILLADVKRKRGSVFARAINPKTGRPFRGRYRVKSDKNPFISSNYLI
ncbi:MAG: hypothetical protein LBR64_02850 [Dysgonamonadaceae bacterium]|jgi:hypothetical protein|nr:hypothetical protein [Dysgonamonadaceae bacterium]